jgi:hypothetical protein
MSISEAELYGAEARFSRVPLERFYGPLGMSVAPSAKDGLVEVDRGGDSYLTTVADLKLRVSMEVLQDHLAGKVGRQATGSLSLLEAIEQQIREEKEASVA